MNIKTHQMINKHFSRKVLPKRVLWALYRRPGGTPVYLECYVDGRGEKHSKTTHTILLAEI